MAKSLGDVVTELMARDVLALPEGFDRRGMYYGVAGQRVPAPQLEKAKLGDDTNGLPQD